MKRTFFLIVGCSLILVSCYKDPFDSDAGTFKDSRDNQEYNWSRIGEQIWMTENLTYLPAVSPVSYLTGTSPAYYIYDFEGGSISEAKSNGNYTSYGVLYNLVAAKIDCPSGWHLPSDAEWTTLTDYLDMLTGKKMKSIAGWSENGNGDNSSGFNALPGGGCSLGSFDGVGIGAAFWSSTEKGIAVWVRVLNTDSNDLYRLLTAQFDGWSVRCIKDK